MLRYLLCDPNVSVISTWAIVILAGISGLVVLWYVLGALWLNRVNAEYGAYAVASELGRMVSPGFLLTIFALGFLLLLWNYKTWIPEQSWNCKLSVASAVATTSRDQVSSELVPQKSTMSTSTGERPFAAKRTDPAAPAPAPTREPRFAEVKPSFDCNTARNPVEKMICEDNALATLDGMLAESYTTARTNSDDPGLLLTAQLQWLDERNRCASSACIRAAYEQRISALEKH